MSISVQLVDLLLDAIDSGYMNEDTIQKFNYRYLDALMQHTLCMENGKELYLKIKCYLEHLNIQRLRKQKKIMVAFIANYASTWIGETLYYLLDQSEQFEPYVLVVSNHNGQSEDLKRREYQENLAYFQKQNLRVIETLRAESEGQYTWEEIGVKPDVCIWLTPWLDLCKEDFYFLNYSLGTLHTYIPYGIMTAENETGNFVQEQYNQKIHNLVWKNFEESKAALEMAEKYSFVGKSNALYTGAPKMDGMYKSEEPGGIWNSVLNKGGNLKAKKVIYAPHHTLSSSELVSFSTFTKNYRMMLELARKYQKETVWLFKPHPILKYKAIKEGIFKDVEEWEKYVSEWKRLKNGEVMVEGTYNRLFLESDAMILDSVSFLAEYLYAHKPLLFLRKEGQYFNDFGRELIKIHYNAWGNDEKAIEEFLQSVVIGENDYRTDEREVFFKEQMDYVYMNHKLAAENIYEVLRELY